MKLNRIFFIFILFVAVSPTFAQTQSIDKTEIRKQVLIYNSASGITDLASKLKSITPNKYGQLYAVYYWLTTQIRYDTHLAFNARLPKISSEDYALSASNPSRPENVLKTRKAVCMGYTALFNALCKEMGIYSIEATGFDKGFFYQSGQDLAVGHSWNLARAGNEWIIIDATWGAGYANEKKVFVAQQNDQYFDVSPEILVKTHLAVDPVNQLLKNPVPLNVFTKGDEALAKFLSKSTTAINPHDTLNKEEKYSTEERIYAQARRGVEFNSSYGLGYIKLAEYHSTKAMNYFTLYQKWLENGRTSEDDPGDQLNNLNEAESQLSIARQFLDKIPRSDALLSSFAKGNTELINTNLKEIRKQKEFWRKAKS